MSSTPTPDRACLAHDVRGSGEPLLLLAGQANSRRWWDPVRDDLAARYATVTPDAPGTGASAPPGDGVWSTRRFAADVVAVLDHLGLPRAHVYGTSMGGKVAQWLAVDHPERLGALVLGATTPGGPEGIVAGPDVIGPLAGPDERSRRALAELMVSPRWLGEHPHGADAVLGDPSMTAAARRGHRRASAEHDASSVLGLVRSPTLVLHGTDDAFCPTANADLLARGVAGARKHLVDGARHAYFLDHREESSRVVLNFLAEHPLGTVRPRPAR